MLAQMPSIESRASTSAPTNTNKNNAKRQYQVQKHLTPPPPDKHAHDYAPAQTYGVTTTNPAAPAGKYPSTLA